MPTGISLELTGYKPFHSNYLRLNTNISRIIIYFDFSTTLNLRLETFRLLNFEPLFMNYLYKLN